MITDQKQKKVLLLIILILFAANIITLYMLMQKPEHARQGGKKGDLTTYLKNDLNFSDAQLESYKSSRKRHQELSQLMFDSIAAEKDKRFAYLVSQAFNDTAIYNVVSNMNGAQKALEIKMLQHLREVRNIGTKEQQMKFDSGFMVYMKRKKEQDKKLKD